MRECLKLNLVETVLKNITNVCPALDLDNFEINCTLILNMTDLVKNNKIVMYHFFEI
jgi:hypothetical protein